MRRKVPYTTPRNRYSSEFKAKVALDAFCKEKTWAVLTKQHGVHPKTINDWKRELLENASGIFDKGKPAPFLNDEKGIAQLHTKSALSPK